MRWYPREVTSFSARSPLSSTLAGGSALIAVSAASGTPSFTEATGKTFRMPVNLSRYR